MDSKTNSEIPPNWDFWCKNVPFVVNDGEQIIIPINVVSLSDVLSYKLLEMAVTDPTYQPWTPILINLDGWTLKKIMSWCEAHREESNAPKTGEILVLTKDDKEYLNLPRDQLMKVLQGACYLNIRGLIDIVQKINNMAQKKNNESLQQLCGQLDGLNLGEKDELKKRFDW